MIEDLRRNIENEITILSEISNYSKNLEMAKNPQEKKLIEGAINSLKSNIKSINNSVPGLLNKISLAKKLSPGRETKKPELTKVRLSVGKKEDFVTLSSKEKTRFERELLISKGLIKRLKQKKPERKEEKKIREFKKASGYLKVSNGLFRNVASRLMKKGYFKRLSLELRKANIDILSQTYVAAIFFTSLVAFVVGGAVTALLIYFGFSLLKVVWLILAFPLVTFVMLYTYPSTERKALSRSIDKELPFAVIQMSSISGSGIEPTKIFGIIGLGEDYPYLRKEIRKILNQINLYGYDLVTALNNVSKTTPNIKLSELFSGLSTTISSGGDLSEFFEKRAESLLTNYRLEREKFTKIAETFMDIYISVVIATPMILMLLVVMISVSGIEVGFTTSQIGFLIVFLVALVNIVFLGILHMKQPSY
jgi:Flp pilus assembly protein TadB